MDKESVEFVYKSLCSSFPVLLHLAFFTHIYIKMKMQIHLMGLNVIHVHGDGQKCIVASSLNYKMLHADICSVFLPSEDDPQSDTHGVIL